MIVEIWSYNEDISSMINKENSESYSDHVFPVGDDITAKDTSWVKYIRQEKGCNTFGFYI